MISPPTTSAISTSWGEDVARDGRQAAAWFEKSAGHGNALAEANLAGTYVDDPNKNYDLAYAWSRKSAIQGCDIGEFKLGTCYVLGLGVDTDFGIGIYWLNKAIAQGNQAAIENTPKLKQELVSMGKDTSPADAATAEDPAAMPPAADDPRLSSCQTLRQLLQRNDLHDPRVAGVVGYFYLSGITTTPNPKEAAKWIGEAAAKGDPFAQGLQFENGIGTAKDPAKAAAIYRTLADKGDAIAQIQLGNLYERGVGVGKDMSEAYSWYEKSAGLGNGYAAAHLGTMYYLGNGVNQDYGQAAAWFRQSAGEGTPLGEFYLGCSYARGQGVKQDYGLAIRWLKKSAAEGQGKEQLAQVRYAAAHPQSTQVQGQLPYNPYAMASVFMGYLITQSILGDPDVPRDQYGHTAEERGGRPAIPHRTTRYHAIRRPAADTHATASPGVISPWASSLADDANRARKNMTTRGPRRAGAGC